MRGTRTAPRRVIRFVIAGLCLLLAVAGLAYATQPPKPGLTLGLTPASQSVTRGQSATYTISVTSTGGFTGTVSLTTTGLPSGASSTFSPPSVTLTSGSTAQTTLTVNTATTTPTGSFTVTVQGTSGKVSGSVPAGLTVNAPLSSSLALSATPASVTLAPGSVAVYTLQLIRTNFPGPITFGLIGGLPAGATAVFTPNPATGTSSTLQLTTPASADDGTYTLNLVASGTTPAGLTQYAYASVQLVLLTSGKPFTISGNLSGQLAPGISRPLDLTLTNPNKKPVSVTNLTVAITSITRTPYAISHNQPCGSADYKITQYSGTYPLSIPANATATLPTGSAPQVAMLDTATNQDGCKGATIALAYSGSGQGS
ncbi:hypothetical protein ACFV9C_16640 [Kribbella sp. NPDC059898]|uniref:COG1470 family protein n=1 Tax=Kribbella sp. NPDC059898 TaxID=3346995 RepID=UPI0036526C55